MQWKCLESYKDVTRDTQSNGSHLNSWLLRRASCIYCGLNLLWYITSKFKPIKVFCNFWFWKSIMYIIYGHIIFVCTKLHIPIYKHLNTITCVFVLITRCSDRILLHRIMLWPVLLCHIFVRNLVKWLDFHTECIQHEMCVLIFFSIVYLNIFLIPQRIQWYIIINILRSSCKVPDILPDFNQTSIFLTDLNESA